MTGEHPPGAPFVEMQVAVPLVAPPQNVPSLPSKKRQHLLESGPLFG